jgi:hypothetical protein
MSLRIKLLTAAVMLTTASILTPLPARAQTEKAGFKQSDPEDPTGFLCKLAQCDSHDPFGPTCCIIG